MADNAETEYEKRNFTAEDAKAADWADNHRKSASQIGIQIDNRDTIDNITTALQEMINQKKLSLDGANFILSTFRIITGSDLKLTQLSEDLAWMLFGNASKAMCADMCNKFEEYGLVEETGDNIKSKTIDVTSINYIMQSIVNPTLRAIFNRNIGKFNTTFGTLNKQIFQKVTEVIGDKKQNIDFNKMGLGAKI